MAAVDPFSLAGKVAEVTGRQVVDGGWTAW